MELTEAQRQAVEYSGHNLQLIACAGSGKTEVVSRRVAHLLTKPGNDRLEPRNIAAFTFTGKAAAELEGRIVQRTLESAGGKHIVGMAEMYVGTIHGFCRELLVTEVPAYLKFETLDEAQRHIYIKRYREDVGFNQLRHLDGSHPDKRYWFSDYIRAISRIRENNIADVNILRRTSAYRSVEQFRLKIKSDAYMDFDEQLLLAVEILEQDPLIYGCITRRIKYLVVDEYQDINPVQERLIKLIHKGGAGLCVVGDDDQAIYQWRGSDIGNIVRFENRYPNVHQITLADNYRSSEAIVDLARVFIGDIENRLPKAMQYANAQKYEPGDVTAMAFGNALEEAEYIANTIRSLYGVRFNDRGQERGLTWSDMAVLVRIGRHPGELISEALARSGIPFTIKGQIYLYDSPEGKAVLDLFRYIVGIEPITRAELRASWDKARLAVLPQHLDQALAYADRCRDNLPGLQKFFRQFLGILKPDERNMHHDTATEVMSNLGAISKSITDWERIHYWAPATEKLCQFITFLRDEARDKAYYKVGSDTERYVIPDAVTISTIHSAKGCEWPVVFIPALTDKIFPTFQVQDHAWKVIPKQAIVGAERYDDNIENEDRLFYVAVTRSRKFLHLTWAPASDNRRKPLNTASRYWTYVANSRWARTTPPDYANRPKMEPPARPPVRDVELSFTHLKHLLECPYRYKLKVLYGFDSPLDSAIGFGKALHDVLSEIHSRFANGENISDKQIPELVNRHLMLRYAGDETRQRMTSSANRILTDYIHDNRGNLPDVQFAEQPVTVHFEDGISIRGRIDLVRRTDNGSVTIVDLKSNARAQEDDVTLMQLHTYALGYRELTGSNADFVEIYELDERNRKVQPVDEQLIIAIRNRVRDAVDWLRCMDLSPHPEPRKCRQCDVRNLCPAALA